MSVCLKAQPANQKRGLHKCACGESYFRKDLLQRHQKLSCDANRPRKSQVSRPRRAGRKKKSLYGRNPSVFACDCGLSYTTEHNLKRHQKTSCPLYRAASTLKAVQSSGALADVKMKSQTDILGSSEVSALLSRNVTITNVTQRGPAKTMIESYDAAVWKCPCDEVFDSKDLLLHHKKYKCALCFAKRAKGREITLATSRSGGSNIKAPLNQIALPGPSNETAVDKETDPRTTSDLAISSVVSVKDIGPKTAAISLQQLPKCDSCGRLFSGLKELHLHLKTTCNGKTTRHKCHCGRSYAFSCDLTRHMKAKHGYVPKQRYQSKPSGSGLRVTFLKKRKAGSKPKKTGPVNTVSHRKKPAPKPKAVPALASTNPPNLILLAPKVPKPAPQTSSNSASQNPVDVKPFVCVCGKCYATETLLKGHMKNSCGLDLRCPLCGKNHPFKSRLYVHMRDVHGLRPETVYPFRPEDEVLTNPEI